MSVMIEQVNDLGAAAYIMMHKYKVIGKKNRAICFEITNNPEEVEEFEKLYRDYLNSEFHRFDSCLMSLKKINEINTDRMSVAFEQVNDLGAAAYIMMHKYKVIGKKGKAICFESDNSEEFEKLYRDYLNSEFHRFDSCLMSLKKINEISVDNN